ncbi:hypothetical protein [Actinomycetospora aeridis]|uniref:Uncharacterized protein n=1 Tax=Actinomycetospora aeridis TaxID=3129231 RepID=A0ABU8N5Y7_9PSEU
MTPDRDDGDSALDVREVGEVAREAADVALGSVPAPRPEVLARVLDGLRDLPAARPAPADVPGDGAGNALPLPRRRS